MMWVKSRRRGIAPCFSRLHALTYREGFTKPGPTHARMSSKLKWLVLPLAVAVLGGAAAPWTLSGDALRHELAEQVMQTAGLRASAEGKATFAILPRPRIKLENVIISDDNGALVIASDVLKGNLRILPLLAGRMELASVQLISPDIAYDHQGAPISRQGAIARASDALPATPEAAGADQARLGTISIVDGSARIKTRGASDSVTIDDINLTLDWPRLSAPASINGSLSWQGETAEIAAWLGKPAAVLRGEDSSATLKIDSPSLQASANGSVAASPRLQFEGRVNAASHSMRALLASFGLRTPLPGPLANVALTGNARASLRTLALSGLQMSIDGNSFEGALAVQATNSRPAISGTLASDLLVLAPMVSDLPSLSGPEGQWSREPLSLAALDFADVDLRFSATRTRIGRAVFDDAGASIMLSNGRLDVTLGQARAYNGQIKGRLSLTPGQNGVDLRASGVFSKVDAGSMMKESMRSIRVTGDATGQVSVEGVGDSVAEIVRSLDGDAQILFKNGDILGLDLEQALRRLEKRPLSIVTEVRSGRTGFDSASVSVALNDGTVAVKDAVVSGLGVQLAVTGTASLADRSLNLHALARQTGPSASARENGPQLMLEIRGPWDDPSLVFDKDSLIRRSEAAAPLMRALESMPPVSAAQPEP
jgi:AsmA protein